MEYRNVELKEYKIGMRRLNAKYIQRFGTPGNYNYVYKSKKFDQQPRLVKKVYGRIMNRAGRFLKSLKLRYGATRLQVKPLGWHHAVVTLTGDKGTLQFDADLVKHQLKPYRTKFTHRNMRLSSVNSELKRKGILRYR
jgi:hypothetical protein